MTEKPIYAYSFNPLTPEKCNLLCSTQEVDGWEEIGIVDRRFAQLIVTALNYSSSK